MGDERFKDLLIEAEAEITEELRTAAKEKIKERLYEILETKRALDRMQRQLEALLERKTEDVEDIPE